MTKNGSGPVKDMLKSEGWQECLTEINKRITEIKDDLVDCKDSEISEKRTEVRTIKKMLALITELAEPSEIPDQLPVETDIETEKKPE